MRTSSDTTDTTTTWGSLERLTGTYYYGSEKLAAWLLENFPESEIPDDMRAGYHNNFRYTEDGKRIYVLSSMTFQYVPQIIDEIFEGLPVHLIKILEDLYPSVVKSYLSFGFGLSDNPCAKINVTVPDEFRYPTVEATSLPIEGNWSSLFVYINDFNLQKFFKENNFTLYNGGAQALETMAPFNNVSQPSPYMMYKFTQHLNGSDVPNNNPCIVFSPIFNDTHFRIDDNWPSTPPVKGKLSYLDDTAIAGGSLALLLFGGCVLYKCVLRKHACKSQEEKPLLLDLDGNDCTVEFAKLSKRNDRSCCTVL